MNRSGILVRPLLARERCVRLEPRFWRLRLVLWSRLLASRLRCDRLPW